MRLVNGNTIVYISSSSGSHDGDVMFATGEVGCPRATCSLHDPGESFIAVFARGEETPICVRRVLPLQNVEVADGTRLHMRSLEACGAVVLAEEFGSESPTPTTEAKSNSKPSK
jgi:hypothetical protein